MWNLDEENWKGFSRKGRCYMIYTLEYSFSGHGESKAWHLLSIIPLDLKLPLFSSSGQKPIWHSLSIFMSMLRTSNDHFWMLHCNRIYSCTVCHLLEITKKSQIYLFYTTYSSQFNGKFKCVPFLNKPIRISIFHTKKYLFVFALIIQNDTMKIIEKGIFWDVLKFWRECIFTCDVIQ